QIPNIEEEVQKRFGTPVNFERAKHLLEENDGAGNTFKATAKPVLIGTAVVGATTMIFSIMMALTKGLTVNTQNLSLLHAPFVLGLITGGAWDNDKKVVEVELKQKGTELHAATVVGDTVGDPFKDTSSVALNPVIKFTTLFGLLAVELAVSLTASRGDDPSLTRALALLFFLVSVFFAWRSFYSMRIGSESLDARVKEPGTDREAVAD